MVGSFSDGFNTANVEYSRAVSAEDISKIFAHAKFGGRGKDSPLLFLMWQALRHQSGKVASNLIASVGVGCSGLHPTNHPVYVNLSE